MTSHPITPPSAARVDPAPRSASPPSGSSGDFAALLNQTSARTAPAEGPKTRPAQPRREDRDGDEGKDDKNASGPDAQAAAAQAAPAPAPAPGPSAAADGQVAAASDGGPSLVVPDPAAALAAAVGATVAPATAAQPAAVTPAAPAPAATAQTVAAKVVAQPADPDAKATDGKAPDGTPAGKLQIPAELVKAKGGQSKDTKNDDQPKRDLPPAPTLPPSADAAAAAPGGQTPASAAGQPAAVPDGGQSPPAPAITTQAQPAATAQTAVPVATGGVGGPALPRASVLQTAERVQELVRIATTRAGNARATLQLRPAELGQVDVHLRTTRDGLVATISAHDQVGHDALQQAGNELRRSLEDKGVQLHSLDLQLGAGHDGFSNQGDARQASSGRRGAASSHGLTKDDDIVAEDELTITTATSAPAGALVDVQA
jgi:flagellar hook-length control protein FliK